MARLKMSIFHFLKPTIEAERLTRHISSDEAFRGMDGTG